MVASTIGRILAILVRFFIRIGRIRVIEHGRLMAAAENGRTMISTNHPSLLAETFLLGALVAPLYLRDARRALWTMPDVRLLDTWHVPERLRREMHCIVTDRRSRMRSGRAAIEAIRVLENGGALVAHPEQGRTFGEANVREGRPLVERNGRIMRDISRSEVLKIAARADALVLPGWIDVPYVSEGLSLPRCIWRLFMRNEVITISFREPSYRIEYPFDLARENKRLQDKIFNA
jgi:hypothetical protein